MQVPVQSMHHTCNSSSTDPHQQMLLLRDGMLSSLLWQSCLRGSNAVALRLDNIVLPTGGNAVPYLVPELRLQAGAVLHLLPDTTKNKEGTAKTRDVMSSSTLFQMAVHHHADAGQPITNCITRPLGVVTAHAALATAYAAANPIECCNTCIGSSTCNSICNTKGNKLLLAAAAKGSWIHNVNSIHVHKRNSTCSNSKGQLHRQNKKHM